MNGKGGGGGQEISSLDKCEKKSPLNRTPGTIATDIATYKPLYGRRSLNCDTNASPSSIELTKITISIPFN